MDKSPKLCTISSSLVMLGAIAAAATPAAYAQQTRNPELEEVVIVGSRAAPRSGGPPARSPR